MQPIIQVNSKLDNLFLSSLLGCADVPYHCYRQRPAIFEGRNRSYKLGDLKDEVTKPLSIEDHLDGPDLGMVVQDGQVST